MKRIRQIIAKFDNEIKQYEVPLFRGAVNAVMDEGHSVLFHNHIDDWWRYSYPLIQYKRIGKKASIVCIEAGVDVIGELFNASANVINIGDKEVVLQVESIKAYNRIVQIWNSMLEYQISNWLPLNTKNYSQFVATDNLNDRILLLENILAANILSFLKGIGIHVEEQVQCKIKTLSSPRAVKYKDLKLMSFDAKFKCNVSLPSYIGLGKASSVGFGMVTQIRDKKIISEDNAK